MTKDIYLSKTEMKAMDLLKDSYGGASEIKKVIETKRSYQYRKEVATKKGYGKFLEEVESIAKNLPKLEEFKRTHKIRFTKRAVVTTQVSAWQGYKVIYHCLHRLSKDSNIFLPKEMISVMPLTDDYIYGGDLLTSLAMCENIIGAKFCSTSLLGIPLPEHRFNRIQKVTGVTLEREDLGNGFAQLKIYNMGTFFGNLCGVEVANNNHLVYLDCITRAALETGANFFLNPSWATIIASLYYCRDIPNISFKISCFLGLHNLLQFRVLLNIIKRYLRKDGTSPIREINLGNAVNADTFIACKELIEEAKIKGISLTAHVLINTDLGRKDFNWFENACKVLKKGYDITLKYESDGAASPDDTIASYFLSQEEREAKAELLGEVLYKKVAKCDEHAKELMKMGYEVKFAQIHSDFRD